eukprot:s547_g10.t1
MILFREVESDSQCWPGFPEFLAWSDLRDPQRWQLVMAWCWFFSGGLAAVVFPILAVRVHYKRRRRTCAYSVSPSSGSRTCEGRAHV